MTRAFYRSYIHDQRRAGRVTQLTELHSVIRLHILREDGKHPGREGMCGTPSTGYTGAEPVVLDPMPSAPPPGLSWCALCVGRLAERMGALDLFAAELASINPSTPEGVSA